MKESWNHEEGLETQLSPSFWDKAYIVLKYTLMVGAHALAFTVLGSLSTYGVPLEWLVVSQDEPVLYLALLALLLIMFGVGAAIKLAVFKFGYRTFVFSLFRVGRLKKGTKLAKVSAGTIRMHFLLMKLRRARNIAKLVNKGLLVLYTAFIVTVPLAANSHADLEDDFGSLSEQIARLTASDKSMQLLTFVYGTVIRDIQANPISFAYVEDNGDPNSSPYLGGGLDLSVLETIRPITSLSHYDDIQNSQNQMNASRPDSVMGLFSLFAGYAIVIMLTLSLGARLALEMVNEGLDSTDSAKNHDMLLKKLITIGASGATSLIITSPLYKGFSLLNLIMFSSLTVGVGITNAFVMNYFEWQGTAATPSLSVNPKTEFIVADVLELSMCNMAYRESTNEPVTSKVDSLGGLSFKVNFSACGTLGIKQQAGDWDILSLDFGGDPVGTSLNLDAHDEEKQAQIREYIKQNYFVALNELLTEVKAIADSIAPILKDPGVEEFVRQCDIARSSNFNVSGDGSNYFTMTGTALEICKGNSVVNTINQARLAFSTKIDTIIQTAYNLSQGTLNLVEDIDGVQTFTKSSNAVDINNPATYKQYIDGWVKYPLFQALSNNANKKIMNLLQMDVEKNLDVKGFGQEDALADKLNAIGITRYINQISYDTTAATNAEEALDTISKPDGLNQMEKAFNWQSLREMDGVFANWVGRKLSMMFLVESNEHAVGQFVNAGHTMISTYIFISSAVGATSSLLSWKKAGKAGDGALDAAKNSKGAGDEDSAIATAGRLLTKMLPGGPIATAAIGALQGALDAYLEMLGPMLDLILPFAVFCAFILPMVLTLMFLATALKWLLQILKTSLFISVSALKIYSNDGREILGQGSSQILMAIGAVGMMPLLIIASFIAVDLLVTPIIVTYQWIVYQVLSVSLQDTAQGPLYIAALIGFLVVPPVYIIVYLYSFPSMAIDSVMQFLSLNLGIAGMSSSSQLAGSLKAAGGGTGGSFRTVFGGGSKGGPAGPGGNKGGGEGKGSEGGDSGKQGAAQDLSNAFTTNSSGAFQYGSNPQSAQIGSINSIKSGGGAADAQGGNPSPMPASMQTGSSAAAPVPSYAGAQSAPSAPVQQSAPPSSPPPPAGNSNVGSINSVRNSGGDL